HPLLLGRAPRARPVRGASGARVGAPPYAAHLHRGVIGSDGARGRASSRRLGARGGAGGLPGPRALRGVRRRAAGDDRGDARELSAPRTAAGAAVFRLIRLRAGDRKSTRLNSSHVAISYAVFCLKKKK